MTSKKFTTSAGFRRFFARELPALLETTLQGPPMGDEIKDAPVPYAADFGNSVKGNVVGS
jgi:hypothetical protein